MISNTLKTAARVLTNKYWLLIALCGAFFSFFALNRGGVVVFIEAGGVFLFINFLARKYRLNQIPAIYWATVFICAWVLLASLLVAPQETHHRWSMNVVRMLVVLFTVHCLTRKPIGEHVKWLIAAVLSFSVCWQFAAYYIFEMPYGTYDNPHYLSTFTALVLPVLYFFILSAKTWFKLPLIVVALMAVDLLLGTGSRPAFLGLIVGSLFVLVFLTKGKWKWLGVGAVCTFIAIIVATGYDNMGTRMAALIADLPREERIQLWTQSWMTLKENSVLDWLLGKGIHWFPASYQQDANSATHNFVFPHLHFLEILYLNGISGVLLIFGGLLSVWIAMLVNTVRSKHRMKRLLGRCITIVFITWLVNSSLVNPFYSKYAIYPLAFILSVMLPLVEKQQ